LLEQTRKNRPLLGAVVDLARNGLAVQVEPEAGGVLTRFRFRDCDILRPSEFSANRLEAACYALSPYANRIRGGAFVFRGRDVLLNGSAGVAHALHGHGWRASWDVADANDRKAILTYCHEPDDWPWAYECSQVVELGDEALRIGLSIRNADRSPMPCGLGFHPRFEASPGARLTARVDGYWEVDRDLLPTERRRDSQLGDWTRGDAIARALEVDNCFWGWDGKASLELPAKKLRIEISASPAARMLHLYLPLNQAERGFCVEPVTHAPDAFNSPEGREATGLSVLEPGETLEMSMELLVSSL
jgi:aldose 1-epimerase